MSARVPRLAYLVSQYPAISHTFILREVLRLKELGFDLRTASINDPDRPLERLTRDERSEAETTFYVKRAGAAGAARAHLSSLLRHPLRYLRGLAFAARLGGLDARKLAYCFLYFVEAVMVAQWMDEQGAGHLHVHFATPASTVGLIASRLAPVTLSITVHGPDEFYDAPGYCLREKIEGAAFICCIGLYARSQLMKLSDHSQWDKFEVSPLGVDPAQFAPRPFRLAPDPFEVICVGRLVSAKGQHVLLAAVDVLLKEGRKVRLRIVGGGPDRAGLEAEARRRGMSAATAFEGAVDQDRIRALYAQADAFALASFAEGIPVVLMEAMAMEIPCVTTFITGIPELIRDGVDGLLTAPSDAAGMAAALRRLMDDPDLRRRLGEGGRRRVIERYSLAPNVDRLAEVFRRRLAAP